MVLEALCPEILMPQLNIGYTSFLGLMVIAVVPFIAIGCGGGEDPTQLKESGPPPQLDRLKERAVVATSALNEDDWLKFYGFKSPRSIAPRWPYGLPLAQLCTEDQFIFDVSYKLAKLRLGVGLQENAKLEWHIAKVESHGRIGTTTLDILHDSDIVSEKFHDYFGSFEAGARWFYFDGEWWIEPPDWRSGCHQDRLFG